MTSRRPCRPVSYSSANVRDGHISLCPLDRRHDSSAKLQTHRHCSHGSASHQYWYSPTPGPKHAFAASDAAPGSHSVLRWRNSTLIPRSQTSTGKSDSTATAGVFSLTSSNRSTRSTPLVPAHTLPAPKPLSRPKHSHKPTAQASVRPRAQEEGRLFAESSLSESRARPERDTAATITSRTPLAHVHSLVSPSY